MKSAARVLCIMGGSSLVDAGVNDCDFETGLSSASSRSPTPLLTARTVGWMLADVINP